MHWRITYLQGQNMFTGRRLDKAAQVELDAIYIFLLLKKQYGASGRKLKPLFEKEREWTRTANAIKSSPFQMDMTLVLSVEHVCLHSAFQQEILGSSKTGIKIRRVNSLSLYQTV